MPLPARVIDQSSTCPPISILIGEYMELTEEQLKILGVLNKLTEPAGCKVIGETSDLPWRNVLTKK
jgi:hypothetical protein